MSKSIAVNHNENIVKLRELTDRICAYESNHSEKDFKSKEIVKLISEAIESEVSEIKRKQCEKEKVKCYEEMCTKIKSILNNVKIIK